MNSLSSAFFLTAVTLISSLPVTSQDVKEQSTPTAYRYWPEPQERVQSL